jgi:hypothetical protein
MATCVATTPGLGLKLISSSPRQDARGTAVAVAAGTGVLVGIGVAVGGFTAGGGVAGRGVAVAGDRVAVGTAVAVIGTVAVRAGLVGLTKGGGVALDVALGVAAMPGVKVGRGVFVGAGVGVAKASQPLAVTARARRMSTKYCFMRSSLHVVLLLRRATLYVSQISPRTRARSPSSPTPGGPICTTQPVPMVPF